MKKAKKSLAKMPTFKKNLILLSLLVILLISAIVLPGNFEQKKPVEKMSESTAFNHAGYHATSYAPTELREMMKQEDFNDKYVVIDVRTKQEYDKGHLPGAVHADYYDRDALKEAAGNKTPITYCSFSAMRGTYAAYELFQSGFKNVALIDGGLTAWAEDTKKLDANDPLVNTIFNHPKNILPVREKGEYPPNMGSVEFNLVATRYSFAPSKMVVKHGQTVTINMVSKDVAHGFALPEFGIEEELLPNEPVTVSFIADRKGNFSFVCNVICGHEHPSMVGNLIVE